MKRNPLMIVAFLMLCLCVASDSPTRGETPSTQPSTRPAGPVGMVHGKVSLGGGLALDKPDLSRAVVYLESDDTLDKLSTELPTEIVAQKNKSFVPNFVVVPRGTVVEFPNWDHIAHNVFSRSAAAPAFDLDRYPYGQSKSRVFDKVGVVQVFCNIHPWMRCIIVVTPNRFFARVSPEGDLKIENVPAGHYQLAVWQERCGIQRQAIEITDGAQAEASFTLKEDRDQIVTNDPPRHDQNYGVDHGLGIKRDRLNLPVVKDSHPAPTTAPCADCN